MSSASPAATPNALAGLLKSTTRLSQLIAGTLVFGYLVQLVYGPAREYLAMVAGRCAMAVPVHVLQCSS